MNYSDLEDLLFHSSSTRQYFLSLPVSTQLAIHEYNPSIHTAADLHFHVNYIEHNVLNRLKQHSP